MEIRQLRAFVTAAEDLHFRKAAERLHLSQPALSKRIQGLESELGEKLFLRIQQTVRLTPAGESFLAHARDILVRVSHATEAVKLAARGRTGRLEVGFCQGMEIRTLPRIVRRFRRRFQGVDLRVHPLPSPDQVEAVRQGRIDLGLVHLPAPVEEVGVEALSPEPFLVVSPQGHKLARCPEATLQSLRGEPFILIARRYAPVYYDLVLSLARGAGVVLSLQAEARSFHDTLSMVAAGLGVALLPESVRELPWKGVAYCRLKSPGPQLEMGVIYRTEEHSELLENFLEVARGAVA